jgi:putative transposase
MDTVHGILTSMKRLKGLCLQSLHHRFVAWTTPDTTSLLLGTLIDQARSKSELVAENALLRKPLIILRRQVKRPAWTKTDRMLLVLRARMARTWKQALFIVQPETRLARAASGSQALLEGQVPRVAQRSKLVEQEGKKLTEQVF